MSEQGIGRFSAAPASDPGSHPFLWLAAAGTFLTVLLVALALQLSGRVPFNADQAMVGLMANDIRAGGHPIFFQESEYAGTIEPHLVALAFALLGPSDTVQRFVVAIVFASFAALLSAAAGIWFGRSAAVATGLYLTLGPAYLLYKGLTSDGHYGPVLLVGAGDLLLLALMARQASRGAGLGPRFFLLGLLNGVGIWVSPLCFTYFVLAAVVLLRRPVRPALRPLHLVLASVGLVVGSLPWWIRNTETGFASLGIPGVRPTDLAVLSERFASFVLEGAPLLLGPAAIASGKAPPAWGLAFSALAALVVLAIGVGAAAKAGLADSVARTGLMAAGASVLVSVVLSLTIRGQDEPPGIRNFQEPRTLLPFYIGFAPLVGYAASRAVGKPALALGLGTALAVGHGAGWAQMPRWKGLENGEPRDVAAVLDGLRRAAVRSVYAPYWAAYPITFHSRGQIVGSPFGSNPSVRRHEDRLRADRDPSPGFLLWSPERDQFHEYLRDSGLSFRRTELGALSLFTRVDARLLPGLRSCRCVPPIIRGDSVSWIATDGPMAVVEGEVAEYRIRFRNVGLDPWPLGVNAGYHWRGSDGRDAEKTGLRTAVGPGPSPGKEQELSVRVTADVPPGTYRLTFDLVIEGVTWFEWKGVSPAWRTTVVVPRPGGRNTT